MKYEATPLYMILLYVGIMLYDLGLMSETCAK